MYVLKQKIMRKNIILLALALAAFAACEKPLPYEPGAPMDVDGPNVYFSNYNLPNVVLASDATEFEVAVLRDKATEALSVPLLAHCGIEGLFDCPATVEFPAGVDSVGVAVKISDKFEMFVPYMFTLSVPEEYTHAYKSQDVFPTYTMSVLQEDYAPYAEGYFYDWFFTDQGWPITMEYSPIQKMYRLSDVWAPLGTGSTTDLTFAWEIGASTMTMGAASYPTGVSYGDYGPVTVVVEPDLMTYETLPANTLYEGQPEANAFVFDFKWTVSAGSFGTGYPQFYMITKTL